VDFCDTLRVPLANGFPLLGGHIPGSTLPSFLTARLEEFRLLCSKIGQLPEAHIAFTLLRSCTYACRVNHILHMIPPSCLVTWNANLTAILRSTVSKLIDGHISERAWIQCIQPIKLGGLGLFDPTHISHGAFIASSLMALKFWNENKMAEHFHLSHTFQSLAELGTHLHLVKHVWPWHIAMILSIIWL